MVSRHAGDSNATVELTAARQQRRARIIAVAIDSAAHGYDAVHIRVVAERAGVAASTVYQYFSSKDHLLVACLDEMVAAWELSVRAETRRISDPYRRLLHVADTVTRGLLSAPLLASAVTRAYLSADSAASAHANSVRHRLSQMMTAALAGTCATDQHAEIGDLIADLCVANMLALVQGRATAVEARHRLERTIAVLSRHRVEELPHCS
ncbi:TetR/AcrR family transcriptional regulator [Mycobacterium sp. PS03-16]|uniref:TetR/AcrR family transcriptional regulator n=1 Tax=Mycobacterium sp. PS03-16 TaxID=2559611 RepID=UPI00107398D8|nr:TetR family transcriptional regulator [Mycobacterium sp. PS03-16]TFV57833.1 TetR/AcrR family transcriptional regulator [Mycobacterium sp. PS03-16]